MEYNIINWISNLHSKTIQFSKSQQLTPSETYFIDKQIHYLDMGQKKIVYKPSKLHYENITYLFRGTDQVNQLR